MEPYIAFDNVNKVYKTGDVRTSALKDVSFEVQKGELCAVVGPSGAGKTTILNILGGIDSCTSGTIRIDGRNISASSQKDLTTYRRYDVGFVFQFYNLVGNLTAKENVELATEICKNPLDPVKTLQQVELGHRMDNFPAQLSGGEQQRVSIARALAKNPKLLLCDEPTGALDDMTGRAILTLLQTMSQKNGMTILLITHNYAITEMAQRIIKVKNGKIRSNTVNPNPKSVEEIEW